MNKLPPHTELRALLIKIMGEYDLNSNSWSKKAGRDEGALRKFLDGTNRSMRLDTMQDYLACLGLTLEDIQSEKIKAPKIPVMGTIGDNDEFSPIEGEPTQFEEPPRFSAAPDSFVAKVTGNSLRPFIKEGWNVYYSNKQVGVPDNCMKELCIVKLKDGRTFVKEVRRGTKPNRYTLISYSNQRDPMEDVDLEWAARISTFSAPR